MGDSPNYVPSFDSMTSPAGMQDNRSAEISHSVANPIVESGEATVVSLTATTESGPSGE